MSEFEYDDVMMFIRVDNTNDSVTLEDWEEYLTAVDTCVRVRYRSLIASGAVGAEKSSGFASSHFWLFCILDVSVPNLDADLAFLANTHGQKSVTTSVGEMSKVQLSPCGGD